MFLYSNANSVVGKMSELRKKVEGFDIVGITETWAGVNVNDAQLAIDGFNMFRMDRQGGKGGGLALYVNERLEANLKEALINSGFKESIWCSVRLEDSRLLVGLCNRCPSSDSANDDALLRLLDIFGMVTHMS
jgi:hypothetical protein